MALADGYVGSFETKYHYNSWRPVTAIRTADTDGNPEHERRPDLDAAGGHSPDPDYDSAHSVRGRSSRRRSSSGSSGPTASLRDLQPHAAGREDLHRCVAVLRRYTSFSQAADENGLSRILVGFHFRKRSKRELNTGARSATVPSTASCARRTDSPQLSKRGPARAGPRFAPRFTGRFLVLHTG